MLGTHTRGSQQQCAKGLKLQNELDISQNTKHTQRLFKGMRVREAGGEGIKLCYQ